MANENKNIHELAAESDEDTSELKFLPASAAEDSDLDYEFEADAATHCLENLDRKRQDESLATLQLELRDRVGAIDQLEYEIEKLRERCTGLETELKAREDATNNVLTELADERKALTGARERIERRDEKVARLEKQLHEQEQRLAETTRALDEARSSAESWEATRAELEQSREEADRRAASLAAEVERERAAHARAREAEQSEAQARRDIEQQHTEARSLLETLRQYIEGRKTQWEQQEVLLRSKDALLEEQQRKLGEYARDSGKQQAGLLAGQAANEELTRSLDHERSAREQAEAILAGRERELEDMCGELDALTNQLAELSHEHDRERGERQSLEAQCNALQEQAKRLRGEASAALEQADLARAAERDRERLSGLVISQREELRELSERLARNEAYADTLRMKLAAHAAESIANATAGHDLQSALDATRTRVAELAAQLEAGRQRESELEAEREEDRRRYEEELEKLRAALSAAEETATDNRNLSEQLASDLFETSSFRVALESQLSETDETFRKQSRELNRELKKLRQQVEDYERKISSKDAAISVLLAELANKPQAPAETEDEPIVQRLSERRSPVAEERTSTTQEKDRLARLLIGTVEGQEVRFPLFKNKLTIGRTANNDIQLKAQYISRRHAVIVCDHDSTRIVDWGSKNGIYVNGVRVSEKILGNGDKLTVGTAEFRFEERPKR